MKYPSRLLSHGRFAITAFVAVAVVALFAQPTRESETTIMIPDPPSSPIALGAYLSQERQTTAGPFVASRSASQEGRVVSYVVANLPDDRDGPCEVRWSELDRGRERPAEESNWRYHDVLGWPDGLLRSPGRDASVLKGELWVPLPNPYLDVGWYFIKLRLVCGDVTVDTQDSGHFWIARPQEPALTASSRPGSIGGGVLSRRPFSAATPIASTRPVSRATAVP